MNIGRPILEEQGEDVVYQVAIHSCAGEQTLWYRLSRIFAPLVSDRSDAALVAMLIPAMAWGEDIHIDGSVSERLCYQLTQGYQAVLCTLLPELSPVQIRSTEMTTGGERAPGVVTGFSAGIDSFCVLANHHYGAVLPGFRLTHLLFNNVGSHGAGAAGRTLFRDRAASVRVAAERVGLPLIEVDSNLGEFYESFSFRSTHTPRNTSVALLLQNGIGTFLYASAYPYQQAGVRAYDGMEASDSITLPLLSTDHLLALSTGGQYSRVEKTLDVAELMDAHETLDVCVQGEKAGNCSACKKCLRTLLTLEIAGCLEQFSPVFDLDIYNEGRRAFIPEVLDSEDPLLREIVAFARERGIPWAKGT